MAASRVRRSVVTAALAACALTLAACSGSSGSPQSLTGARSTTPAASTPTAGPTPAASPSGTSPSAPPGTSPSAPPGANPPAPAPSALTLPDGTTSILPGHRVVAYYGAAVTPPDNALPDAGTPDQAAAAVLARARMFATPGVPVLGAFELIATIIQSAPGASGDHASDLDLSTIEKYEKSALKNHLLLVLDIQPGTGHYLPHVSRLEKLLMEPNVSIALDPEWQFLTGGYQNKTGSSTAAEINTVSAYLSQLVTRNHLPQKLFVLHQFTSDMITDRRNVINAPGVATVMHIDGIGSSASGGIEAKVGDYAVLHGGAGQFSGFKLFFKEDTRLMTPKEVLALKPAPDLVTYQ